MPGIVDAISGAGIKRQEKAMQAQQRRSLADLAAQQGELDQATAAGSQRRRGSRLLTFLSGEGQATLG